MYIVSLLTGPEGPGLEAAAVEALRTAWGGGAGLWLAPDRAAEFALTRLPDNLAEVRASLGQMAVDVNVLEAAGRRKRLLIADMDSTMIQQECIDELAEMAGVGARVRDITARAMNGELDFDGAVTERVALLAGLSDQVMDEVYASRITHMPGGATLLATMKAAGAYAALVSGGFTYFTGRVAADLGFDENRANVLEIEGGKLTGRVVPPILGRDAKVAALAEITARLGVTEAQALAVGDGANDLGMLGRAGMGVALHAKPSVAAACDIQVNHGDLTALLYLQGYAQSEFV